MQGCAFASRVGRCIYRGLSLQVNRSQESWPAFTVPLSLNLPWVPWDLRSAEPSSASRESLGFLTLKLQALDNEGQALQMKTAGG